jgi:hypothetical protein
MIGSPVRRIFDQTRLRQQAEWVAAGKLDFTATRGWALLVKKTNDDGLCSRSSYSLQSYRIQQVYFGQLDFRIRFVTVCTVKHSRHLAVNG